MTIVFYHRGDICEHINYIFYGRKELLKIAKKYGLEKGFDMIVIPEHGVILNRHGKRWYQ